MFIKNLHPKWRLGVSHVPDILYSFRTCHSLWKTNGGCSQEWCCSSEAALHSPSLSSDTRSWRSEVMRCCFAAAKVSWFTCHIRPIRHFSIWLAKLNSWMIASVIVSGNIFQTISSSTEPLWMHYLCLGAWQQRCHVGPYWMNVEISWANEKMLWQFIAYINIYISLSEGTCRSEAVATLCIAGGY